MPISGGTSTNAGVDYEITFVAYKLIDLILNEAIGVKPQARYYEDLTSNRTIVTSVDDVIVTNKNNELEFYNVKSRAPNKKYWTLSALKDGNVLTQLKNQFKKSPTAKLFFVSSHPCDYFDELFIRASNCSNRDQLEIMLKESEYLTKWDELRNELEFNDEELINFSKIVKFQFYPNSEEIKKIASKILYGHVTKLNEVIRILFEIAMDGSKTNKNIKREDVLCKLENEGITLSPYLKKEELLQKIMFASGTLENYPSVNILQGYHINRQEVNDLLEIIHNPLPKKEQRVIILTGEAGCGKTVILRDLLLQLRDKNIPVLGIKADILMHDTISLLQNEISLNEGIKEVMGKIVEDYGKAIVLIDQIDALSLSISRDRKVINNYINLVTQLNNIENLVVIISCREYDLNYDAALRNYLDKTKITVGFLTDEEITDVLKSINIDYKKIPKALMGLLRKPLHLKIFCDLYTTELDFKNIKSLKDLYDLLWKQKVVYNNDTISELIIIQCIEVIVNYMDLNKTLTLTESVLDGYSEAMNYLISQGILTYDLGRIQFFHQSFFDYCFARLFTLKNISLLEFILSQHQGLFIRSQIKYVLDYLRESEKKKYITEIQNILTHKQIRFHIRLLLINFIGSQQNVFLEEKKLVDSLIETDSEFRSQFIDSIFTVDWLNYMISKGYLKKFIYTNKYKDIAPLIQRKLSIQVQNYPNEILGFIVTLKKKNKIVKDIITDVLWHLDDWSNDPAIKLFLENIDLFNKTWLYEFILEKLVKFKPDIVSKEFFKNINKKIKKIVDPKTSKDEDVFDYHEIELYKKLLEWNKKKVLQNAIKVIIALIDKSRFKDKNSRYYSDNAFFLYLNIERDLYDHWKFLHLSEDNISSLAKENIKDFKEIFNKLKYTFSDTIINSLLICLSENYNLLPNESFNFIMRKGLIESVITSYYGKYYLLVLINKVYPLWNEAQKKKFNKFIFNFKIDHNSGTSKESMVYKEYPEFSLIGSIPYNEVVKYPELFKRLQELERKYGGKHTNNKPRSSVMFGTPAPLPNSAYEKMNFAQLIDSFKKYDDSTAWGAPREHRYNGGIVEHSRAFAAQVTKKPEYFYDFINNLGNEGVSTIYIQAGLSGLVEAKYYAEKIRDIILKYFSIEDSEFRKGIIRAIEYIHSTDDLDLELINILKEYALNDSDPAEEHWEEVGHTGTAYYGGDPLTDGINHVRGSAVYALLHHAFTTKHPNILFEIFEKVAEDSSIAVKCCLIVYLQAMKRYDRSRTYNLFMKITKNLEPQLIRYGVECLYYLMDKNTFESFMPHLRIAQKLTEKRGYTEVAQFAGQLLMLAHCNNYSSASQLLEESLNDNYEVQAGVLNFSIRHLTSENQRTRDESKKIFLRLLNSDSKEITTTYSHAFLNDLWEHNFIEIYLLLLEYSKSLVIKGDSHYYLDYLLKCVNLEPEKCLDLIENYINLQKPDIRYNAITGKEPMQILIGAYNRSTDENYKEKAMNVFDMMLKDDIYKREGQTVISEVERF